MINLINNFKKLIIKIIINLFYNYKNIYYIWIYIIKLDEKKLLQENINNINANYLGISRSSSNSTLNEEYSNLENQILLDNNTKNSSIHFEILSNPEFLAEGTAVNDILNPDRILIGGLQTKEGIEAQELLSKLYSYWVPEEKIIKMGLWSAELSKLVKIYIYITYNL